MSSRLRTRYTPEEYLALERSSREKHEYVDGELFAMGGASERHNLIALNLGGEIRAQLKSRPCKVYTNDMRVKMTGATRYTYPNVVALHGTARFDDEAKDTLVNPNLIIEVLSETTEAHDRGEKFEYYRRIESLAEFVLVAQDKPQIEQFCRQPSGAWIFTATSGLENSVEFTSISCRLPLADVYDKVDFE